MAKQEAVMFDETLQQDVDKIEKEMQGHMTLSDLSSDEAADFFITIMPDVQVIINDKKVKDIMASRERHTINAPEKPVQKEKETDKAFEKRLEKYREETQAAIIDYNQKTNAVGMKAAGEIAMYLLKNKRKAVWGIVGALNKKTPKEVGEQSFMQTMAQVTALISDSELTAFLTYVARLGATL